MKRIDDPRPLRYRIRKLESLLEAVIAALRNYHAMMGNIHMLNESTESREMWMKARKTAQLQAQAALRQADLARGGSDEER